MTAIVNGLQPRPTTIQGSSERGFRWELDVDIRRDECFAARFDTRSLVSQLLLVVHHRSWDLPAEVFVDGTHVATIDAPLLDDPVEFREAFDRQAFQGAVEVREHTIELYLAGAGALIARPEGIYEIEVRHADGGTDAKMVRFWRGGSAYLQFE
ncbi:hypothetical protein [Vulgatibacter sp.]|uniref:hypothetical protein n=1 Tax=Vulgatibacter sp. TaxID=1971226 RepID=UPI003562C016